MALVLADRVKETTTTTGTGAIALAGAVVGFRAFSATVGDANTCYYTIADQSGANWEVGIGIYTSSGNTLSRDTVIASSNAGVAVTFGAGTKDVFVTYPAGKSLYLDASNTLNMVDNLLVQANIKDYAETIATPAISSGTLTLDMTQGNVFNVSHNANITTLTISNPPASGNAGSLTLFLTQDATGGRTIAFPASVKWGSATPPTLSTAANGNNCFVLLTFDGGTTWRANLTGKDYCLLYTSDAADD